MIDAEGRRIGVYGYARRGAEVLLVQIHPAADAPLEWTLPGGGMEWGESPLDTLRREVEEETGLIPAQPRPALVRSAVIDRHVPPLHSIQVVYRVEVTGQPRPEVEGSTIDARWIALREVPAIGAVPMVLEAVARLG